MFRQLLWPPPPGCHWVQSSRLPRQPLTGYSCFSSYFPYAPPSCLTAHCLFNGQACWQADRFNTWSRPAGRNHESSALSPTRFQGFSRFLSDAARSGFPHALPVFSGRRSARGFSRRRIHVAWAPSASTALSRSLRPRGGMSRAAFLAEYQLGREWAPDHAVDCFVLSSSSGIYRCPHCRPWN